MEKSSHVSIKRCVGFFNEATTYGAKGDVSCKAELIPQNTFKKIQFTIKESFAGILQRGRIWL